MLDVHSLHPSTPARLHSIRFVLGSLCTVVLSLDMTSIVSIHILT